MVVRVSGADIQVVLEDKVPRLPTVNATLDRNFDKADFVKSLQESFSGLKSFSYSIEQGIPTRDPYAATTWKELGPCYYAASIYNASQRMQLDATFDGTRTHSMTPEGFVNVWKGENTAFIPKSIVSPLDLYSFLLVDHQNFMKMYDLRPEAKLWKELPARVVYLGPADFMGHDSTAIRFGGGYDRYLQRHATYDVFFDAHDLKLLGWKNYDDQGRMMQQFEALDWATVSDKNSSTTFTYAPHWRASGYQWPGTLTSGRKVIPYFQDSAAYSCLQVSVNNLTLADVQFDPSLVHGTVDMETHIITRISK